MNDLVILAVLSIGMFFYGYLCGRSDERKK